MDRGVARMHDARDNVGERPRRLDRALIARFHDGAGDRAGVSFLTERGDNGAKIALACARDNVGCARAVVSHAHVEGPIEPERESALRLIELHRRHAKIEDDAVDRRIAGDRLQVGEPVLDQFEPALRVRDQIGPAGDRTLVAIDADHACARRLQNGPAISAGSESGVDIDTAVTHREPFDNAADKHRNVTRRSGSDSRAVAARHHVCAPKICAPKICAPKICAQSVALRLERHRGLICARPDHLDNVLGQAGLSAGLSWVYMGVNEHGARNAIRVPISD